MLKMTRNDELAIAIETGETPGWSVIWLHGLGADGSDFVPIVRELDLPAGLAWRFIFPHAPYRRVTCNGGYEMRAWYDIISLAPESRRIDEAGLLESVAGVHSLIAAEKARGIPAERIFLAGFSQGGAVAYTAALSYGERLAGVLALSTYLPAPHLLAERASAVSRDLPILALHGSEDSVVAPALGRAARDWLLAAGYQPQWAEYPMGHELCLPEVQHLSAWLKVQSASRP